MCFLSIFLVTCPSVILVNCLALHSIGELPLYSIDELPIHPIGELPLRHIGELPLHSIRGFISILFVDFLSIGRNLLHPTGELHLYVWASFSCYW